MRARRNITCQISCWTNQAPCLTNPWSNSYLDFIYLGEVAWHLFHHLNHLPFHCCAGFHILYTKSMLLCKWNMLHSKSGPLNTPVFPPPLLPTHKLGHQLELTKELHEITPVLISQSNARIFGDIRHNLLIKDVKEFMSVMKTLTLCIPVRRPYPRQHHSPSSPKEQRTM